MAKTICVLCGKDCSGSPHGKDAQGRPVHRACYEKAGDPGFVNPGDVVACLDDACGRQFKATKRISLAQLAKGACPDCGGPLTVLVDTAAEPADEAPSAGGLIELASPGDVVYCSSATCGREFRATKAMSLDPTSGTRCPTCGSPLHVRIQPDEQPASPAASPPQASTAGLDATGNFTSFLDEELAADSSRQNDLAGLLGSGQGSDASRLRQAQQLIGRCLAADPTHCPFCGGAIEAGAAACITCGLEFRTAKVRSSPAADDFRARYANSFLTQAHKKEEEAEQRVREAQAEQAAEFAGDLVVARLILRSFLGG